MYVTLADKNVFLNKIRCKKGSRKQQICTTKKDCSYQGEALNVPTAF